MKFFNILFTILVLPCLFCGTLLSQTNGDFRSLTTGNWADASTWETYSGSVWVTASSAPSVTSGTITIQSGHIVTVASAITISSGCNVFVDGYLKNTGGITATTSTPLSFTFNNGSTYEHAMAGGSIPMSTWNNGSTCLITGTTGASPGNGIQNFYNFIWNCPSQSTGLNLAWDNVTIGGNLTVTASGASAAQQFRMTSAATTRTITINGDVIINGGYLTASGSSGAAQYNVTVKGNIDIQSGKFNLCGGSGGYGTWRLWGNLTVSASGQFVVPSNKSVNTRLIFAGGGTQQYTFSSSVANANLSYGVENGSTVILNSPLTIGNTTAGNGGLVLTSGKFVTTSTNLITLASGAQVWRAFSANVGTGIAAVDTSTVGYVDGPLATTIATASAKADTLPIGKGSYYRPTILNITQSAATSTIYTTEYFNTAPTTRTLPSGLDAVNSARYLKIVKGSGATVSSATIQMSYNTGDDNVGTSSMVRVAKDDKAGNWINLGGSGTANNTGTVFSDVFTALDTNDFVLAHVDPTSLPVLATLSTTGITYVSTTFATGGGNITNSGNAAITARGVCWNTSSSPDTTNSKTSDGTGSGAFISPITGLTAGQTYYIRAYAVNSAGVAYGGDVSFTTLTELSVPTITTSAVTNIVNRSATGNGNLTAWGGSTINDRGVCWSTSHNPTISNDFTSIGAGGTGAFTAPIGGLAYGTTYYVRAYATNSTGTGYGDEVSFISPAAQPDVYKVVDKNGTVGVNCDYTTVQAAFDAVTPSYAGRWIIFVKTGTYYEKTWLLSTKINVVLIGEDRDNTILTYDDYAGKNSTTDFAGGTIVSNGTNTSFSCAIDAPDFEAQNITFRNTANAYAPGSTATQAVALRTNGDRQEYYNCKMLGFQDTYYTQGGIAGPDRLYHKNCYIEGAVDFIFGRDVALFDSCTIFCNRTGGVLTAGATESGYTYGYVFKACTLASTPAGVKGCDSVAMVSFYLGRPWQSAPKTVYLDCYEPATVNAAGWTTMGPNPSLYAEYNCSGPGYIAGRPGLAAWGYTQPTTIMAEQAATYTITNIFSKNNKGSGFVYAANWTPSKEIIDYGPPLPVQLASFIGNFIGGNSVKLEWETISETNNFGFYIEKYNNTTGKFETIETSFQSGKGTTLEPQQYSWIDENAIGNSLQYRLKQIDNDGLVNYFGPISMNPSDMNEGKLVPAEFKLNQNYPNPFNPMTNISFSLENSGYTTLIVYNILGKVVATLFSGEAEAGRMYKIAFDVSASGSLVSGLFFYRLQSGSKVDIKKLMVLK
jgi:pectin methylesterase-like acyl-CoA thioesterase